MKGKLDKIEIHSWWKETWSNEGACLCVTGSVARGEGTEYSDTDILLLHENKQSAERRSEQIIRTLHARMEHVSVVARSLQECDPYGECTDFCVNG